jgi:hypothetical protein
MYKQFSMLVAICAITACGGDPVIVPPKLYVGFPAAIDPQCRDGKARIYDECGDQSALFGTALAQAKTEGKVLLVSFGSEWCIWCHVFEAHVNGQHHRFRYTYGAPDEPEARYTHTFVEGAAADAAAATALRDFVAANFVIVHIDAEYAPNGWAVLDTTGAREHYPGGIPFVFTVDESGRFAAMFNHDAAEVRRESEKDWYRGYDRDAMTRQLAGMRDAARAVPH